MTAGIAIRDILLNTPAVTALVGDKISPMVANQTEQYALITFQEISDRMLGCKAPDSGDVIRLQLNISAKDYITTHQIKKAVKSALNAFSGEAKGVKLSVIEVSNGRDLYTQSGQINGYSLDVLVNATGV